MKRETRGRGGGGQHGTESRKSNEVKATDGGEIKKGEAARRADGKRKSDCERREGEHEKQGAA
jgi:hypothetical protein